LPPMQNQTRANEAVSYETLLGWAEVNSAYFIAKL
jgi:hypothetical protein